MYDCYIVVKSVTYAQRVARALERGGISSAMTRTPLTISSGHCSYAVKIAGANLNRAEKTLRGMQMPMLRIFMMKDNQFREVRI